MRSIIRIICISAVVAALVMLCVRALAGAEQAPDKLVFESKMGAVTFDHAKHGDVACVDCHHDEADGKFKCGGCHKAEPEGDIPKIKDAMHKKDSGKCRSCHFGKQATAKKLKCADCHKK